VLEAATFPRHAIGESLVRIWPVFDQLGVTEAMEAAFQHKYGSGRIWGDSLKPKWTSFDEHDPRPYSLHVRRSQFDLILADRAQALGADIRFGWRALDPVCEKERICGIRARGPDGVMHHLRARHVIDASGRAGFLSKRLKLRRYDPFYPDLSVYTYYTGARRFPGTHAGSLFIEAVPLGWLWFIPLRDGEVSVGLVCDTDSRAALKRQGPRSFLADAVRSSASVAWLLADATTSQETRTVASGGYTPVRYAGPGYWLAGGDFADPMWATGVANAMRGGIRAASAVHGVLSGTVTEQQAITFHDGYSAELAAALDRTVKYVYGLNQLHADAPFWRRRHSLLPESPESLRRRGLGWLVRDPNAGYFGAAFTGMGVEAAAVAELDERLGILELRRQEAAGLAGRPLEWIPCWVPGSEPRQEVGMDKAGIVRPGIEVGCGENAMFTANPVTVATLTLIDGKRTAEEMLSALPAAIGRPADAMDRARALAALKKTHAEGATTIR
jgi:flavin-dependent dehydrogenase